MSEQELKIQTVITKHRNDFDGGGNISTTAQKELLKDLVELWNTRPQPSELSDGEKAWENFEHQLDVVNSLGGIQGKYTPYKVKRAFKLWYRTHAPTQPSEEDEEMIRDIEKCIIKNQYGYSLSKKRIREVLARYRTHAPQQKSTIQQNTK